MPKSKKKYPEVEEIKDDLESLKDNTVELANHIKEDGAKQIEQTSETLKTRAQIKKLEVEQQIKTKPLQSVALAFAGGMALSMLLRGRR